MRVIDNNGIEVFFSDKKPISNYKIAVKTRKFEQRCEIDITEELVNRLDTFFKKTFKTFNMTRYYYHKSDYTKMRSASIRNKFYIKDKKIIMERAQDSFKRSTTFQIFSQRKAESFMCHLVAALNDVSVEDNSPFKVSLQDSILAVHDRYGFDAWYRSDEEFLNDKDVINVRAAFGNPTNPTKRVRELYLAGKSIPYLAKEFTTYGGLEWVEKVIENIR